MSNLGGISLPVCCRLLTAMEEPLPIADGNSKTQQNDQYTSDLQFVMNSNTSSRPSERGTVPKYVLTNS